LESLSHNYLKFFDSQGEVQVGKVREFLSISRKEIASVFGVSESAIREDRIAPKTKERVKELAGALEFVAEAFKGDLNKTKFWINTPNPHFGGASPKILILHGRYHKVLKFILAARSSSEG